MEGERDLSTLLRDMRPFLNPQAVVILSLSEQDFSSLARRPIALFREEEGITVILPHREAEQENLADEGQWAWITLRVHSSLQAVGFLARITSALAQAGISTNVFSAYYHDHLFVPWDLRFEAMEVLKKLCAA
jgi:hypothetical protein